MARNRLVDRAKAAATRSAAESPTERHQRRYKDDLAHEIGPTTFGRPLQDEGDGESLLHVMTQPAMILILAIITFALTFIGLLWREGRLDYLFAANTPEIVQKDPKAWMLGRNADGVIEDTTVPEEVERNASTTAEKPMAAPLKQEADATEVDASPAETEPVGGADI